jgi:hypothetical protein
MTRRLVACALAAAGLAGPATATAANPIPEGPSSSLPQFTGSPWSPRPVFAPLPPRHPFMAPNGSSNLHEDAYQSDASQRTGPLGRDMRRLSTFYSRECGSVTFDSRGRIVTVCVGLDRPILKLLDPKTLDELATMDLPPRRPGDPTAAFTSFGGGGYFYLDQRDRAVIPTTDLHIVTVAVRGNAFVKESDVDVSATLPSDDSIISALPDWSGALWFASKSGVVGRIDPATGAIHAKALDEPNGNSFAVGDDGGVYIVTDAALYRFDAGPDGGPSVTWREPYGNTGQLKPGQTEHGSGTTPTLMGDDLVAITDNADPMNIVVMRRAPTVSGARTLCTAPVFDKGASATDNSLIATGDAMVVENNYGYSGPSATEQGRTTTGGLERVDVDRATGTCAKRWHSKEIAPSVVAKLSRGNGLVYTYTKDRSSDNSDGWYLTALDWATGRTVYKRLAGEGLGFNNNYAPVTIGADGTAYVGVLGGLVALRDATAPTQTDLSRPPAAGAGAGAGAGAPQGLRVGVRLHRAGDRPGPSPRPLAHRADVGPAHHRARPGRPAARPRPQAQPPAAVRHHRARRAPRLRARALLIRRRSRARSSRGARSRCARDLPAPGSAAGRAPSRRPTASR